MTLFVAKTHILLIIFSNSHPMISANTIKLSKLLGLAYQSKDMPIRDRTNLFLMVRLLKSQ